MMNSCVEDILVLTILGGEKKILQRTNGAKRVGDAKLNRYSEGSLSV